MEKDTIEHRARTFLEGSLEFGNDEKYAIGLFMGYQVGAKEQQIVDEKRVLELLDEYAPNKDITDLEFIRLMHEV